MEYLERIEIYEAGFRKFRERDFIQARIRLSQFLEIYPKDALSKMYLERAREYDTNFPTKLGTKQKFSRKVISL